jgi:hypothetical protein
MTLGTLSLNAMSEHILEARHEQVARDFCGLLREGVAPLEIEHEGLRTASPFLNVPAHIMVKADGELRGVNYDHTIMGVWRSLKLGTLMPKGYEQLPYAQAMWYLPQGLDIWSQILCEFPGHYSREQEKCPTINLRGPKQHFEEYPPLSEGSFDDRLGLLFASIVAGDKVTAFRVFLSLADEAQRDETKRARLESQLLCTALADLPGPRQRTGLLVNPAHKAIRTRAMIDLAAAFGWEHAYPAFFVVIPDLCNNPRNYDLFESSNVLLRATFGPDYRDLRRSNQGAFTEQEAEAYIRALHQGTPDEALGYVTALLQQGKSLVAINDVAVLAAARLMTTVENPSMTSGGFFNVTHCIDYANVAGFWLRRYDHPQQLKSAYLVAHHVNDTARFLRFSAQTTPEAGIAAEAAQHAARVEQLSLRQTREELAAACGGQDAPLARALLSSYLRGTTERHDLIETLAFEAAKIEGDPHLPRLASSHFEEYTHSHLPRHLRDDLLRSWGHYIAYCRRRSDRTDCLRLYEESLL